MENQLIGIIILFSLIAYMFLVEPYTDDYGRYTEKTAVQVIAALSLALVGLIMLFT